MTAKRTLLLALGKVGFILTLAVAFFLSMLGTVYLSLRSPEVRVPEVVSQTRWRAEDALHEAGLSMRVRATRYVQKVEPDTVLSQSPGPGEAVKVGQTIAVVVSRAPGKDDPVAAPDVEVENSQVSAAQNQNAVANNQNANAKPPRPRNAGNSNANVKNSNASTSVRSANGNVNANKGLGITRNSNINARSANANNANRPPARSANVNRRPPSVPTLPERRR